MDEAAVRPFDADNHYYEPLDAFTRHLDPKHGPRTVQIATINGRTRYVVGGKINHAVTNPTFNPIVKPGCLYGYFRANPEGKERDAYMRDIEPIPAHYREPDARIRVMDEQGLDAVWLFPTLGVLYEEALKHDPEAVALTFRAFNRWLDDDWGLHHHDRIFSSPYIPLVDVDWAVEELEWALDRGARVVCMRPAAPTTAVGPRSPGHRMFDPFWARVAEAGVTVAIHAGNSGYGTNGYADDGQFLALETIPLAVIVMGDRPPMDFFAAVLCDKLFDRFPTLRMASIENGAGFMSTLFRKLRKAHHQRPGFFSEDPVDTFRRHVWINPFWEDDIEAVVDHVGVDRILFGSDWPHAEGLVHPLDYLNEIKMYDPVEQRKILRDNAAALTELQPA